MGPQVFDFELKLFKNNNQNKNGKKNLSTRLKGNQYFGGRLTECP